MNNPTLIWNLYVCGFITSTLLHLSSYSLVGPGISYHVILYARALALIHCISMESIFARLLIPDNETIRQVTTNVAF